MSALDELLKDIPQDYDEVDVANHLLHWREPSAAELIALRADLADAKARAAAAEKGWHANEARIAKLLESIKAAQVELHATQRNWDEECLFECNDILTAALKGVA